MGCTDQANNIRNTKRQETVTSFIAAVHPYSFVHPYIRICIFASTETKYTYMYVHNNFIHANGRRAVNKLLSFTFEMSFIFWGCSPRGCAAAGCVKYLCIQLVSDRGPHVPSSRKWPYNGLSGKLLPRCA